MSSKETLKKLLEGKWTEFAASGGEITESSNDKYLLSQLYIHIENRWVQIYATEIDQYYFHVGVGEIDYSPVPEPSKIFRPPRKLVTQFPDDLRLDEFGEVMGVEGDEIRADGGDILCGEFLVIKGSGSKCIIVKASYKMPCNIEISMI